MREIIKGSLPLRSAFISQEGRNLALSRIIVIKELHRMNECPLRRISPLTVDRKGMNHVTYFVSHFTEFSTLSETYSFLIPKKDPKKL